MGDLFEIMRTTRSMRRLKPDPVPDDLLRKVLEAGTFAANGGNMQSWRFLVIRDPATKQAVAAFYRRGWHEVVGPRYRSGGPPAGSSPERFARMLDAAEYLAEHFHEAPVWIVPCQSGPRGSGSSISCPTKSRPISRARWTRLRSPCRKPWIAALRKTRFVDAEYAPPVSGQRRTGSHHIAALWSPSRQNDARGREHAECHHRGRRQREKIRRGGIVPRQPPAACPDEQQPSALRQHRPDHLGRALR